MWGYGIPEDADPIRWFKLLLVKDEDLHPELRFSDYIVQGRKMMRDTNKTASDLIADYLRPFWKHTLYTIAKTYREEAMEALIFKVVVTVPAIWKDYARKGMMEAIEKAGIFETRLAGPTTVIFAPEPEAAAMATLFERKRHIREDDVYVVCDAGGGTVVSLNDWNVNSIVVSLSVFAQLLLSFRTSLRIEWAQKARFSCMRQYWEQVVFSYASPPPPPGLNCYIIELERS